MTPPRESDPGGPDEELDAFDQEILTRLGRLHERLDGPPADFDATVIFALSAAAFGAEVARLEDLGAALARSNDEIARTMSFEAPSLTILLTVTDVTHERFRIDGWLAPAGPHPVRLRSADGRADLRTVADAAGRFVFDGVRAGLLQMVVRPGSDSAGARTEPPTILTPAFRL